MFVFFLLSIWWLCLRLKATVHRTACRIHVKMVDSPLSLLRCTRKDSFVVPSRIVPAGSWEGSSGINFRSRSYRLMDWIFTSSCILSRITAWTAKHWNRLISLLKWYIFYLNPWSGVILKTYVCLSIFYTFSLCILKRWKVPKLRNYDSVWLFADQTIFYLSMDMSTSVLHLGR